MIAGMGVVGALLLVAATPTQAPNEQGPTGEQAQDAIDQAFDSYFEHFYDQKYAAALKAVESLDVTTLSNRGRAVTSGMRAAALLGLGRKPEAEAAFAEAERLGPDTPFTSKLLLDAGLMMEDMDLAADALDRMIARFPDEVRKLDENQVFWILKKQNETNRSKNDDRRVALARLGFGGEGQGDYLAKDAVGILLKRGDTRGATELLGYVDEPREVEDMLIQRRFATLWPALEEHAGPRLEKVRASAVRSAEREYEEAPDDNEKLHILANALRHSGRHDQALALESKLPTTSEAMATVDEDIGWALNNVALALHEVGRSDDADRLFARLNDAPMEAGLGRWRVSMIINRLELLVGDGRFDRAAELLDLTEGSASKDGSPYAQQLVRRLRYCTMAGLGRTEEAARLLPEFLEHAKDARHATVDALLCGAAYDEAERIALEGLDDEDFQEQFARSLQPRPLTSDDPSIWAGRWDALRERPQIAAAYQRLARDMPEALVAPSPRKE